MSKLNGKVAVVTGGNSGIGYASAKDFIANGAKVIITGRNAAKVEAAASELGAIGLVADQGKVEDIDELVNQVKQQFGTVDILFVNAGIFYPAPSRLRSRISITK